MISIRPASVAVYPWFSPGVLKVQLIPVSLRKTPFVHHSQLEHELLRRRSKQCNIELYSPSSLLYRSSCPVLFLLIISQTLFRYVVATFSHYEGKALTPHVAKNVPIYDFLAFTSVVTVTSSLICVCESFKFFTTLPIFLLP